MSFIDWLNFFGWQGGTVHQVQQEIERRAKLYPELISAIEALLEANESVDAESLPVHLVKLLESSNNKGNAVLAKARELL